MIMWLWPGEDGNVKEHEPGASDDHVAGLLLHGQMGDRTRRLLKRGWPGDAGLDEGVEQGILFVRLPVYVAGPFTMHASLSLSLSPLFYIQ